MDKGYFLRVVALSRDPNNLFTSSSDRLAQLASEVGEVGDAILIDDGKKPHKATSEPISCEVADVVIAAVDILADRYPQADPEALWRIFNDALAQKVGKWERVTV